jgi:hypothetical protein
MSLPTEGGPVRRKKEKTCSVRSRNCSSRVKAKQEEEGQGGQNFDDFLHSCRASFAGATKGLFFLGEAA